MTAPAPARTAGWLRTALLILPCILLVTACATQPVSDEQFRGLPEGVTIDQPLQSPLVTWKYKPQSITVTTWGSSSCPPSAIDMTLNSEKELVIAFESVEGRDCTADLAPTTHVFTLPDDAQHSPLTVKTSLDGALGSEATVLK